MRRAALVLLLWSSAALLVAPHGDRLLRRPPPPPWRQHRILDWRADDAEAERVGKEAVEGALQGWGRFVSGVTSAAGDVVGRVHSGLQGGRTAVEGVAKGVQEAVSGAANDAGELVGSVIEAANPSLFPGTNWCGAGDRAHHVNDTGVFGTADRCCRMHDSCPESIGAGDSKHGLNNDAPYTMSLCECDREFYQCLKKSNSLVAKNIGFMFFNVLKIKCFTFDYPQSCKKESLTRHCEQYYVQSKASKIWQRLDNPSF